VVASQTKRPKGSRPSSLKDLGFQSKARLAKALRIETAGLTAIAQQCEDSYPYIAWWEQKRSGKGSRLIEHPRSELKQVQSRLNRLLQRVDLPPFFHGCFRDTSIKSNAEPHLNEGWYLGLDIADYYGSIRPPKVYSALRELGAAPNVARLIVRITTVNHHVPQGAPTSPIIAAFAMLRMARRIDRLIQTFGGRLTIYGDNISVTAKRDMRRYSNTVERIVNEEGFRIRPAKKLISAPGSDRVLPGLTIKNGRISISDVDLATLERRISQCLALSSPGLARRVCPRFETKLRGFLFHYAWLDKNSVEALFHSYADVSWPREYSRYPCRSPQCNCDVL